MANLTSWYNETTAISDYTNPFTFSNLTHGQINPNHTTDISLVYRPSSLPTPWPYLTCSIGLSLIMTIYGYVSALDRNNYRADDNYNPTTFQYIRDFVPLAIATIRCFSAFIRAIKAFTGGAARWAPPSALFLLTMSTYTSTMVTSVPYGQLIGMFNTAIAYIAFELMIWGRYKPDAGFYGRLFIEGGTCQRSYLNTTYIGCEAMANATDNHIQEQDLNKIMGMNLIGSAEFVLGALFNLSLVIVAILAAAGICMGSCYAVSGLYHITCGHSKWKRERYYKKQRKLYEQQQREELEANDPEAYKTSILNPDRYKVDGPDYDGLELKRLYSVITIIVIVLIGIVSIPIHYSQQTSAKKLWVYDGHGPQVLWNSSEHTFDSSRQIGESWSDSFHVPWVTDRLGFLGWWWEDARKRPLEYLAVV
jgi:hypothetical protein